MIVKYELKTKKDYDLARDVIRISNTSKNKYRIGIMYGGTLNGEKQHDKLVIEWIEVKPHESRHWFK